MNRFYAAIYTLLLLAAVFLVWMAWQDGQETTVLVEWTTASELDTAGFNLHRSDSQAGPFTKINTSLIPASSDPLTGGSYTYEDHQVQPGVVYYYRLEEVELNGGSSFFGPISVKAEPATGVGFYLSLAVIAAGMIYAVYFVVSHVRKRAGGKQAPLADGQQ